MPGFFLRDLDCSYCGNSFTDMEGDMILPIPRLCDDCLKLLWPLSEQALAEGNVSAGVRALLEQLKQQYPLEGVLSQREINRKTRP